jgi:hypothetical protein
MNDKGAFEKLVKEVVGKLTDAIEEISIPDAYNDTDLVKTIDAFAANMYECFSDHTRELGRCADALEEANKLKKRKLFK